MNTPIGPTETERQLTGPYPDGQFSLSVLAKRTYRLARDGRCVPADQQVPLSENLEDYPDAPGVLAHDTDLYPRKPATDVVVNGYAYPSQKSTRFQISLRIADVERSILVVGDRQCTRTATGQISFSDAKPVEQLPIRYDRAYGGRDGTAEAKYGNPLLQWQRDFPKVDLSAASPYLYPRNPKGVGYVVEPTAEALERVRLPNFEDPLDPLTPERLPVGNVKRWAEMPIPHSFGWVSPGWFPRLGFCGVIPQHDPLTAPLAEAARGWVPPDFMTPGPITKKISPRLANGAALGLQLPYLRGDEECVLTNIHPKHSTFRFRLPGERPKIWTDGRNGKFNETQPVIHTVLLEPEEDRLSIVWRGSAPALRPYLPQELEKMPFRVEW